MNDEIDPVTARETVMALEMLLSDFSMGCVYGDWLRERMRAVDGKDDCELSFLKMAVLREAVG